MSIQTNNKKLLNYKYILNIFMIILTTIYFRFNYNDNIHTQLVLVTILFIFFTFIYNIRGNLLCLLLLNIYKIYKFSYLNNANETSTILIEFTSIVIISILSAIIYEILTQKKSLKKSFSELDSNTGFFNYCKLNDDLNTLIQNNENFTLVFFHIVNYDILLKNHNFEKCKKHMISHMKSINSDLRNSTIYSHSMNKYFFIIKNNNSKNIYNYFKAILDNIETKNKYKKISFTKIFKIGIVEQNEITKKSHILMNVAINTANQGNINKSSINIYDKIKAKEFETLEEIAQELPSAISNNEFYLVYQPIIDIKNNCVSSCEILTRWDRGDKPYVGPNVFIKIAEDIELIQELTKWIAKESMKNFLDWKKRGYIIKQSINVTIKELLDPSFRKWSKNFLLENEVDCNNFGIEITERVKTNELSKVKMIVAHLKNKGYTIEIDDFGTGFNSLMFLSEIPTNIVKIDKFFIDKIYNYEMQTIIKALIDATHTLGALVIAEGVEDKKQYQILKEIGCDKIQGYYFSKPLKPDDYFNYHKNFNINNY